ncbi:YkgJ family cysteine cluster protein [Aeromonas enteropelogenes]|uniref:YkgJ family cysteine cluster protein n=1 Tax=Aeromonas enteropelogenes TaxID=29489 RepID=UPI00399D2A9A
MQPVLTPFPCTACGQCCRRVSESPQTVFLDAGNGVCRYFNEQSHNCTIYADRPLVCRVEDYYRVKLAEVISWDEFVKVNVEICQRLQQ